MLVFLFLFICFCRATVDCPLTAPEYKLGPRCEGSLLNVTFSGTVGILLEDIPREDRKSVSTFLMNRNEAWWITRAKLQIHYGDYDATYRASGTFENGTSYDAGQLPLPPDFKWIIKFSRPEVNGTWRQALEDTPLLAVYRKYEFYTIVITDYESPAKSDIHLGTVGGSV